MSTATEVREFDESLEPEIMTDKEQTKLLPCRNCGRPCVVNQFASPSKTECSTCRQEPAAVKQRLEFNDDLETEVLTDKDQTKEVPCIQCGRRCVVTLFKTPSKTKCNTCQGVKRDAEKREVQVKQAHTVNPATLADLRDGLINPEFRTTPLCPFSSDHRVELKHVGHSVNYGPRQFLGWKKDSPVYDQRTGEVVTYQCLDCNVVISYSTQHPLQLRRQNEILTTNSSGVDGLVALLGAREGAA